MTNKQTAHKKDRFHWVWQNTVALLVVIALLSGGTFGILRYFTEYPEETPLLTPNLMPTFSPTASNVPTFTPKASSSLPDLTPTPSSEPTPTPIREIPLLPNGEIVTTYNPYDKDDLHLRLQKQHAYNSDIYIADVYFEDVSHIKAVFAKDSFGQGYLEKPSAMVNASGVFFAVNGDYYGFHEDGIVARNGILYRNKPSERQTCMIFRDGSMKIAQEKNIDAAALMNEGLFHAFTFGPALVIDGEVCSEFDTDVKPVNPRCGIGMVENGHMVFVVVDGRRDNSPGVTISDFAALMHDLGCTQAYNMDGGATALMIYEGKVISNPSGNFERKMSDILGLE